jgi:hypothetical protein
VGRFFSAGNGIITMSDQGFRKNAGL